MFNDKLTAQANVSWPTDRLHVEFLNVKGHISIFILVNEIGILVKMRLFKGFYQIPPRKGSKLILQDTHYKPKVFPFFDCKVYDLMILYDAVMYHFLQLMHPFLQ